jgi:hypothetical protein
MSDYPQHVHVGDQVRLRPREAPQNHPPLEWWTVTCVYAHGFDAMRSLWHDIDDGRRHRYGIGFDQITAGPVRIGAEL